jgi:hypothetical protein
MKGMSYDREANAQFDMPFCATHGPRAHIDDPGMQS